MNAIDDNRLIEFLEGRLDETANREIERWYDAAKENQHHLETLYLVLYAEKRVRDTSVIDPDAAFKNFRREIRARRRKTNFRSIVLRYSAAAFIGLFVLGGSVLYLHERDHTVSVHADANECRVELSDGSSVCLAPHSQLQYSTKFTNNRMVELQGAAFFNVRKLGDVPFTVRTVEGTRVVVHGTKFQVKAYSDFSNIETLLVEGSVEFYAGKQHVELEPGQKASYNPVFGDLTLQKVNVEAELNPNYRTFHRVPLSQMVTVLSSYYNREILMGNDSLGTILFTGTLDFSKPFDYTLEILTLSTNTLFSPQADKTLIYE